MKTLIETSIKIHGIGHPDTKTILDLKPVPQLAEDATNEQKAEKSNIELENALVTRDSRFKSLTKISGRHLHSIFKYTEDGEEKFGRVPLVIPVTTDEEEIKNFILSEIANHLSS